MTYPVIVSIENAIRFLQDEIKHDVFLNIEIGIEDIKNKNYHFKVFQNRQIILEKTMYFSDNGAIFLNSHEDPIISDNTTTYLSMAIERKFLTNGELHIEVYQDNSLIYKYDINEYDMNHIYQPQLYKELYTDIISPTQIKTIKKSHLTLHLNDNYGVYSEIKFELNNNDIFDFSPYLAHFSYIGVQFSFEDETPEVEEKYIIKGQKGIRESGYLHIGNTIVQSNLPFRSEYVFHYFNDEHFQLIQSIDELLEYHQKNPLFYFESHDEFLAPSYRKNLTYSQANLYSLTPKKKHHHIDTQVCLSCHRRNICMQTVPSGLSYHLFKENIALSDDEQEQCRIFQLISQHA